MIEALNSLKCCRKHYIIWKLFLSMLLPTHQPSEAEVKLMLRWCRTVTIEFCRGFGGGVKGVYYIPPVEALGEEVAGAIDWFQRMSFVDEFPPCHDVSTLADIYIFKKSSILWRNWSEHTHRPYNACPD